ncbi:hypothetical protein IQ13_1356 [Lacibacter cauensis]|uniref:Uncharacterized protein n=1 Tax=Lacibacter cauensis TaxID=510947 RepID=A0A562SPX1_9BACT|nr:hypothetical protein [Lacibacter cauensis]TWI83248.1 hypothetical protein IQ13_1356 [Lacibacter cauensis]
MAQQKGILPLKGTIGNINFYKTKDGYLAREKTSVNKDRIANDPAFARTRENGAEFGRAGAAGKVLRTALRSLLLNTADSRMLSRLTREMMKVIQADAVNERGLRNVIDGEATLLEGFDFNAGSKLSTSLFAPYTTNIDRVSGALSISIPSFVPVNMVAAPSGATHFKIVTAGVEIDFENKTYVVDFGNSNSLPINSTATAVLNLSHQVTANSTKPLFLAMGIEFYQEVNGNQYSLKNGAFNALSLVKVSGS